MKDIFVAQKEGGSEKSNHNSKGLAEQLKTMTGEVKKEGWLSSFTLFPKKVCFDVQDDDEEVILFLRQHPIVNLGWIVLVVVLSVLPLFFYIFPPYEMLTEGLKLIVVMGWYLGVSGFALAKFLSWYFNIFIMTDERVIDVDFLNLFSRVISDAEISKIQDVSVKMAGVWQTFFNYGNVFVQTAGEVSEFVFDNIPYPDKVVKILHKVMDMEEEEEKKR